MKPNDDQLNKLITQIIEIVNPIKIILFGSAARNEMTEDSDFDILVVMPEGIHRRRTAQKIYQCVSDIKVPFEIIVATSTDLEKNKDNIGLIYRSILLEGKLLYAA